MKTTVIYITNNVLDPKINALCQKNILESIGDLPLISVSQEPMNFGENICVGKIGGSSLTINQQMLVGVEKAKTEFVAIAEHDCLYTKEHFSFTPPDKKNFWYNTNVWLMQYGGSNQTNYNGLFSIIKFRKANSQLICGTDIMIKATKDKIAIMSDPAWLKKYPTGRIGEAGALKERHLMKLLNGRSVEHLRPLVTRYATEYVGKEWSSKIPNIDIRHEDNYTKCRRGSKRKFRLGPWGTMEDVLNGP